MRVTQSARSTVAAVLVLALAACGKDGSGPSEFDPDGTTADMSAADEAFGSPVAESFAAVGTDISFALGGSRPGGELGLARDDDAPRAGGRLRPADRAAAAGGARAGIQAVRRRDPVGRARHHLRLGRGERHATSASDLTARRRPACGSSSTRSTR